jgi:hypothetical protein
MTVVSEIDSLLTFSGAPTLVTQSVVVGEIVITGSADFAADVTANGVNGTALLIDGGGTGSFGSASQVTFGSNVTIGDAGGSGTIGILSTDFLIGSTGSAANLVIAGSNLAAGSIADISGGLTVAGNLELGVAAAATLDLSGVLNATTTTIDAAGILNAGGDATASFGGLVDAGTLDFGNSAQASATNLILTGVLQLAGQSALTGLSSAVIGGAGTLSIGTGAEFGAGELNLIGGGVSIAGSLQLAGNLLADAAITLNGGTLSAAAATLSSGGLLSGFGDLLLGGGTIDAAGGDISVSGGTLVIAGNVTMGTGSSIAIAGGAALDLSGAAGGSVVFGGINSELIINDLAMDSASVTAMAGHDVIDLAGVAPTLVSYAGGVIGAGTLGHFSLSSASGQPAVEIISDGSGGALITLGGEMACFARGTRLLTPNGYVPVEAFKPGDPIITEAGAKKPVRWIGRRIMQTGLRTGADLRPVVVRPGALGAGCPSREIRLSPSHAIFLDGVLVPAMHLVNGATIIREPGTGSVTYYHIELDRHEVVLADRLPVETYLDTGNRGQFEHETGVRGQAVQACAPLVLGGARLAALRRQLHQVAIQAGFTLMREPSIYGVLRDLKLLPEMRVEGKTLVARFALPPDAGRLMLIAPSAAPADTDPDSDDRRELAICLRQTKAKPDRLRLGAGWYEKAKYDAGFWMGGSGEVFLAPGAAALTLRLAAVAQRWQPPAAIDFHPPGS